MARSLKEIGSEQEQIFDHNQDSEFDHMLASVPESVLDSRRYYWPNFNEELLVHHHRHKFVYSFRLPAISQSRAYYVATFGESLLLTWIGLEAKVLHRIGDSTSIQVNVVSGSNPFDSYHNTAFHYCHVPLPVRRQEHREIHRRITEDRVDYGQQVHVRVHRNYSLELSTRIGCHSVISDIIVVIKVQTPKLVGGTEDHIMWDHSEYKRKKKYEHDNFLYYKKMLNNK